METKTEQLKCWAVLELMGHRRLAGYVQETQIAGHGVLRLDVPGEAPGSVVATQFYSPTALYALTPTTEEMCRAFARHHRPEPITRWELPSGLTRVGEETAEAGEGEDLESEEPW